MPEQALSLPTRLAALAVVFSLALCLAKATAAAPHSAVDTAVAEVEAAYQAALAGEGMEPVAVDLPPLAPLPPAEVSTMDLRIVLAQLAQSAGANGQLTVLRAQAATPGEAVVIKGGVLSLTDLLAALGGIPGARDLTGVARPVVIWPGARLELAPGDTLRLSRAGGAFVVNFGALVVDGATITAAGPANPRVAEFQPFLVTAGAGHARITGATLRDLGFVAAPAFSGVAFVKGGLFPAEGPSILANSTVENAVGLTFRGTDAPLVAGNLILSPRRQGIELRGTTGARLIGNTILDAGASAIRVTNRATGSVITGNRLFKAAATALHIETASHNSRIADNLIWGTRAGAIILDRADCTRLTGNTLLRNRGKGIALRAARGVEIAGNTFLANTSAAVYLAEQPQGTETRLTGNTFAFNHTGLSAAAGDTLLLTGNDFTEQFPRFLDGDLTRLTPAILQNLRGDTALTLEASFTAATGLPPLSCGQEG